MVRGEIALDFYVEIKSDYELCQEFYEAERDWQLVEVERVFGELFIVSLPHGSSRLQGRLQFIGWLQSMYAGRGVMQRIIDIYRHRERFPG